MGIKTGEAKSCTSGWARHARLASATQLETRAVCRGRKRPRRLSVGWNQRGITAVVMGVWKQEVGLLESRHAPCLWPPPFFLLRRSSLLPQSIYMLSATGKSRLNNSLRLGMMSSLSRLIWPQNTHETQCVFRFFFFSFFLFCV